MKEEKQGVIKISVVVACIHVMMKFMEVM